MVHSANTVCLSNAFSAHTHRHRPRRRSNDLNKYLFLWCRIFCTECAAQRTERSEQLACETNFSLQVNKWFARVQMWFSSGSESHTHTLTHLLGTGKRAKVYYELHSENAWPFRNFIWYSFDQNANGRNFIFGPVTCSDFSFLMLRYWWTHACVCGCIECVKRDEMKFPIPWRSH